MIADENKGIVNIAYNHLNLPTHIDFGENGIITYLYDATGKKVKKTVVTGENETITHYLDGFQYKGDELQFFPTSEGYVNISHVKYVNGIFQQESETIDNQYSYVYNYLDHLGNIRLSYGKDPSNGALRIIEENHYYPFGLKHTNYNSDKMMYVKEDAILKIKLSPNNIRTSYNYKYNGKELQDELGLNVYDYGMMMYDPVLGRRNNVDPKAEESRRWSPYSYCYNNPMRFVDPDGMKGNDIIVMSYGPKTEDNETHKSGHQAILIGDDKHGWNYFSLDGDTYDENEKGVTNNDFTEQHFDSLDEFANSSYNTFKEDYDDKQGKETSEKSEDGSVKQRYKEAYRITTTPEQDTAMNTAAKSVTEKGWNFITNNCTAVPEAALNAAGLNNGESSGASIMSSGVPNFYPQAKQKEIERSNKGKNNSEFLKPKK